MKILERNDSLIVLRHKGDGEGQITRYLKKTPYKTFDEKLQEKHGKSKDPLGIFNGWEGGKYSNIKYGFAIEFPDGLEYDRGTMELTLARAINRKKGIVFSVNVNPDVPTGADPNNITETYSEKDMELVVKLLTNSQNTVGENIKVEKGSLHNFPAYIIEYESIQSSGSRSIRYIGMQVQCMKDGKIYNVAINLPKAEWTQGNQFLFRRVIDSFKFINY
jgi:hypothetical protein